MSKGEQHDPLAALNLPSAVRSRAVGLLVAIDQASTVDDCVRAADRPKALSSAWKRCGR